MTIEEIERRQFFRISDRLLVQVRVVNGEESTALARSLQQNDFLSDSCNDENLQRPQRPPTFVRNELYDYLEVLDRKLNTIIELLSKKEEEFQSQYVDVNISGAGLRYCSPVAFAEGTYLELRIVLPFFPNPRIAALGRITRCRRHEMEDGNVRWETAVSFVAINENHRDTLISYIFSKEREQLRAKHAHSDG